MPLLPTSTNWSCSLIGTITVDVIIMDHIIQTIIDDIALIGKTAVIIYNTIVYTAQNVV